MIFFTNKKAKGFSLVELLVALALGAFLLLVIVNVFSESSRNQKQDAQINVMQENGRFALRAISRPLSLGGFWGGVPDAGLIAVEPGVAISGGCDVWAEAPGGGAISLVDEATVAELAAYDCLDTTGFIEGTDVLAILRVSDSSVVASASGTYLAANAATGILFQGASLPAGAVAPVSVWRYMPEILYVTNDTDLDGNDIPTLCRYALNEANSTMERRCLADGVENVQIEFGIDTNDDYIADYYATDPTAAEQLSAVSAKIYVLVRSTSAVIGYTNSKTYNLGSTVVAAANDNFMRRVFSATVVLKNSEQLTVVPI